MKYCVRCIIPDTRPNIDLDSNGVCNACATHEAKSAIDWAQREEAFRHLIEHARKRSKGYDCVIPVSGGKDSTWQVIKCLEYGLHPLAITWKTPARTEIGARNLANLVNLGVDHIDYQINPNVEKKFVLLSLKRHGTTAIPMHMAIFNIPLAIASKFDIPLVVWGENSAFEYGGTEDERHGFALDSHWLKKYGVTHGTTAEDWISSELTRKELTPYFGPSQEELERHNTLAVFLGYYFQWDPHTVLAEAKAHGFRARDEGPKTGFYNYADIDDDFISIHHYLKWYKFGFTRSFDNLSLEIRNGRLRREEAIEILRTRGDETPKADIARFCSYYDITTEQFYGIIENFRNIDVWKMKDGTWIIENFLIKDWKW
jgi:N-acetyl sugar amidotransferase